MKKSELKTLIKEIIKERSSRIDREYIIKILKNVLLNNQITDYHITEDDKFLIVKDKETADSIKNIFAQSTQYRKFLGRPIKDFGEYVFQINLK